MASFVKMLNSSLCVVLLAAVGLCYADDDVPPDHPNLMEPHLILTEVGGGSDSSVSPDGKWLAFSSRASGGS